MYIQPNSQHIVHVYQERINGLTHSYLLLPITE